MTKEQLDELFWFVISYNSHEYDDELAYSVPTSMGDAREILRLARLGIWAEEHRATISDAFAYAYVPPQGSAFGDRVKLALAALPNLNNGEQDARV